MEQALDFKNKKRWRQWLAANYSRSPGVWLALGKKASQEQRLTYAEALDVALCFGWIDAKRMSGNDEHFVQRFVPRTKRSIWSKINCGHVQRLLDSGEMHSAGLAEVERAKNDGRWDAAYEPASKATVPEDLQRALDKSGEAKAFFATLNGQNRYAILFRIQRVKQPETRSRKIAEFIAMLERKETIY